ncbi:HK97-gp10 family putative phage morphogenesis protein [Sphingobium yanoikuyae]|uniref:HK97-gp10 family putative phage morphogenesis protein n=2 Tax=Sphingobium TaxID=165695 RepID=UPI0028A64158|nr:HK97-gp10 family putative phage morphogenesis protein [Sphingobium yanoikuyae]
MLIAFARARIPTGIPIMANVKGADAVLRRFKRLASPEMKEAVRGTLYVGGGLLQEEAKRSIMEGSVSGKNHVPSKPGEPPNNDLHELHNSIIVRQAKDDPTIVEVSATAAHAVPLEFGTGVMAERPFMRPAARATKDKVARLVTAAVTRETEK